MRKDCRAWLPYPASTPPPPIPSPAGEAPTPPLGAGGLPVFSGTGMPPAAPMLASGSDGGAIPWPGVTPAGVSPAQLPSGMLGLATVPPKLKQRIVNREYVEMYDMLPTSWRVESEAAASSAKGKRPRREPIKDIQVWAECYSVYAAILTAAYPEKAPHLFAYMRTIVRASRQFAGHEWVSYDMTFRRTAANQGSLEWGVPNPGLYNDAFTGAVRSRANCFYCLDAHASEDCPEAPDAHPPAVRQSVEQKQGRPAPRQAPNVVEVCRQFNGVRGCRFSRCRYAHLCERCHGPHPVMGCGDRQQPMGRSRSPPPGRPWDPKQPR